MFITMATDAMSKSKLTWTEIDNQDLSKVSHDASLDPGSGKGVFETTIKHNLWLCGASLLPLVLIGFSNV